MNQLLTDPDAGYFVRPVFATRKTGYRYARDFPGVVSGRGGDADAARVEVEPGDVFLELDPATSILPLHRDQLFEWKRSGVRLHFMVHDILAVRNPQWFTPRGRRNFKRWLRTLAIFADGLICSTQVVKEDVADWLATRYALDPAGVPVRVVRLGADISASLPSVGLPAEAGPLLEKLRKTRGVLMVGTIEPRKGHARVLAAFEKIWDRKKEASLVIVGKPGWRTEALQKTLRFHPQTNKRLFWLDGVSDEMLVALYTAVKGVIVASEAEGFGLPLVEAAYYKKPILASDIPVFREICEEGATFFSQKADLAEAIDAWLERIEKGQTPPARMFPGITTWRDSVRRLLEGLTS